MCSLRDSVELLAFSAEIQGCTSIVPSPSHPLAAVEKKLFLHGCEIKFGVGRTGNDARAPPQMNCLLLCVRP